MKKTNTKRLFEAEQLPLDRISTLPQPILETILCLLSTKEAVRTSILSREWRYKWTKIPKLELSHRERCIFVPKRRSYIENTRGNMDMKCKFCDDLNRILLQHQGPIHELTLDLPEDVCLKLDQIIFDLSKNNTVKKLSLWGEGLDSCFYKLPIYVFSFRQLTDLDLHYVDIGRLPTFDGFGSLRSLCLSDVGMSTKTFLHLLSNCPSLKILNLENEYFYNYNDDYCTINKLFKCLPVIEHLTIWLHVSQWLVLDAVPQELPTSLVHLKYFCFEGMFRVDGNGLAFLLLLIKCSPNLEKIKLVKCSILWEEYSDVWLEHLNELEIECFRNSKREMEFVKFILARSPKLQRVMIGSSVHREKESQMLKTLLQAPRVSPVVITVT
ncbi:hypothetical protein M8C21_005496 [Ambrosia artemisiifolia]|uniref:FBD domain-containing protein n=1 Tax=Ambrosia artemisiifolia TaxID=4212 RepID=A0AAD5BMD9_AMBAR|nr:hypothetical protein M8C21_005496 [Ambrosia artemisiifolia]